jgi:hypothetical protein
MYLAGGQNADTNHVPNLSLLCLPRCLYQSELPPIPARAVRRLRLNAVPLPKRWSFLPDDAQPALGLSKCPARSGNMSARDARGPEGAGRRIATSADMNAPGLPTRYKPEHRRAHGRHDRAIGDHDMLERTAPGNTTCGVLLFSRPLYTGAKELSYPACRRSAIDSQAQGCAGRAPQSRRIGGGAIFPRVVLRRSFLLWP